jgi:DNA-binding LytR/AlgR family response regulator
MSVVYSCLVVEDEPLAQNVLKKYIGDHPFLELTGICQDAQEAQQVLLRQTVQLIFLDINLPRLSGINFLKTLSHPPLVIFTTAYPEFAAQGFEMDAVDYLLKPFSYERFLKAVNKALEKLSIKENISLSADSIADFIFLKADKKVYKVNLADILYLEANDDYVKVVVDQNQFLVNDTLKNLQNELPSSQFIRVHKSYIIAKNKIVFFEGNYVKVANKDIPIGMSYREEIFARLKEKNL